VLECAEQSPAALVLDADALTVMAQHNMLSELRRCATARAVVITPHKGEFRTIARALELAPDDGSPEQRLSATRAMADALQCTVLAKGTPTICASPAGDAWIVPRGSNALATGGTGDVLSGVIAALLAAACANAHATTHQTSLAATHQTSLATTHQTSHATTHQSPRATTHQTSNATAHATHNRPDAPRAAALAALAAWVHGVAGESLPSRGSTVTDVVHALPTAWSAFSAPTPLPPGVLAHLPTVHAHVTR
jgi:NAD(P)H-hydrate repair Nnr-like enzyme with NAD(P)H-hydrate dehydratase domain